MVGYGFSSRNSSSAQPLVPVAVRTGHQVMPSVSTDEPVTTNSVPVASDSTTAAAIEGPSRRFVPSSVTRTVAPFSTAIAAAAGSVVGSGAVVAGIWVGSTVGSGSGVEVCGTWVGAGVDVAGTWVGAGVDVAGTWVGGAVVAVGGTEVAVAGTCVGGAVVAVAGAMVAVAGSWVAAVVGTCVAVAVVAVAAGVVVAVAVAEAVVVGAGAEADLRVAPPLTWR